MKNKLILSVLLVFFTVNPLTVNPLLDASTLISAIAPPVNARPQTQSPAPLTAPTDPNAPLDAVQQQAVDASQLAAETWLKMVDQGSYGNSWEAGALPLRLTMTRKEWISSMQAMRKSMGRPVERKIADIRLAQNPKNLARGNYMVFVFQTTFSSRHIAREILTLQQGRDSQWRVLTYLLSQQN